MTSVVCDLRSKLVPSKSALKVLASFTTASKQHEAVEVKPDFQVKFPTQYQFSSTRFRSCACNYSRKFSSLNEKAFFPRKLRDDTRRKQNRNDYCEIRKSNFPSNWLNCKRWSTFEGSRSFRKFLKYLHVPSAF